MSGSIVPAIVLTDGKVKVSVDDTVADFLESKLVAGSSKVSLVVQSPGGNETLELDIVAINVSTGAPDAGKLIETDGGGKVDGSLIDEADDNFTIIGTGAAPDIIFESADATFGGFAIKKSNTSGFLNYMPNAQVSQIIFSNPTTPAGLNQLFLDVDQAGIMYLNTLPGAGAGAEVVATDGAPLRPDADLTSDLGRADRRWRTVYAGDYQGDGSSLTGLTSSQISDFASGVQANETLTSLTLNANVLEYTDEDGSTTNLDLSIYLDDTNLARIVSGTLNGLTGIATFTRDDLTTFDIDFSDLIDVQVLTSISVSGNTISYVDEDSNTTDLENIARTNLNNNFSESQRINKASGAAAIDIDADNGDAGVILRAASNLWSMFANDSANELYFGRNNGPSIAEEFIIELTRIDFKNKFGVNLLDPVNPQDAATKAYVDAQVSGASFTNNFLAAGDIGAASNAANQSFDIDLTNAGFSIGQSVRIGNAYVRGDLSGNGTEYIDVGINSTGDPKARLGETGYDDLATFRTDGGLIDRTYTVIDIGGGTPGLEVFVSPSAQVNFSPTGMPNGWWWQLKIDVLVV